MDTEYVLLSLALMALVTFVLRALPFLAAQWLQRHPLVQRLGQFLPLAIMTLLVLHALAGAALPHQVWPWREALTVAVVVVLQWYWRRTLWSILLGTAIYVLLRNLVQV